MSWNRAKRTESLAVELPNRVCEQFSIVLLFRIVVGALLIVSGILKAISPVEFAAMASAYSIPYWLVLLGVQVELGLGAILLSGCFIKTSLRATLALFLVFTGFSLYQALAGYHTCGCFGPIKVHPWLTVSLDILVVVTVVFLIRRINVHEEGLEPEPIAVMGRGQFTFASVFLSLIAFMLCAVPSAALMVLNWPRELSTQAGVTKSGNLLILEPTEWVGAKLPIASHLSPAIDVSSGTWTILLSHHDCPECQTVLPQYAEMAEVEPSRQVLIVEVPPVGHVQSEIGTAQYTQLSGQHEWFVETPLEIVVEHGVVRIAKKPDVVSPILQTKSSATNKFNG